MEIVHTVLLAVLVAFMGFSPPGMLNMTALKLSLEHSRSFAMSFVLGASTIIFFQALIAVTFAKFLGNNPQVIYYLKYGAIVVFIALAFFFFKQAKRTTPMQFKTGGNQGYLAGVTMSLMNMLAIPFFLGYSTLLEAKGLLNLIPPFNLVFSFGAFIGSIALFGIYVWFAAFIQQRVQFIARNINYILSLLFIILAVSAIVNTFFS